MKLTSVPQVRIDWEGMRPESLAFLRARRALGGNVKPIEVSVYPDTGAVLVDGRHRLKIAREHEDRSIQAIVRTYGPRGGLLSTRRTLLTL